MSYNLTTLNYGGNPLATRFVGTTTLPLINRLMGPALWESNSCAPTDKT